MTRTRVGVDWQTVDVLARWQAQTQTGAPLPFPRPGTAPRGDGPISFDGSPPELTPPSARSTPLVTYACTYEATLHVFYLDEAGHLQEPCGSRAAGLYRAHDSWIVGLTSG